MSERARYERDGDLGVLTIDDPPLNLFGRELTEAILRRAWTPPTADSPRALVVRAEGKVFTGGADVNVFHGLIGGPGAGVRGRAARAHPHDRGPALSPPWRWCTGSASPPGSSCRWPAT